MKSVTIVSIVLALLIILSLVQTLQLNSLKENIASGDLSIKSSGVAKPLSGSGDSGTPGSLPTSIQNLPQMVGGC